MNKIFTAILAAAFLSGCVSDNEPDDKPTIDPSTPMQESLIVCDEGNSQSDNGQLSYFDGKTGTVTNQWFRTVNGYKLGDTPNDIIQVNDTLIAISVNWSNLVQYIHPDGTACGATENVPNNRRLCTDGRFIYLTSYAHQCAGQTFPKGYVAKIDVATKQVVGVCQVGWEPEGICIYEGKLYVANTGGYAFSEDHDYETTIAVVDPTTMTHLRDIDTGYINLMGRFSQAGQYICIGSAGDYYETAAKTVVLDCKTEKVSIFDFPTTVSATNGELFFTVGSDFSYLTGEFSYHIHTIDPKTGTVTDEIYTPEVTAALKELTAPYCLYVSPYTGNIYFTDARSYATAGYLHGYTAQGEKMFEPQKVYINPGSILAIKQ